MKGYRISFIRHGMTEANEKGRYIGVTDLPLSDLGAKELIEKSNTLNYPRPQKIYLSPLERCKQTAQILLPNCYTAEVPQFCEMNFGEFENKSPDELANNKDYENFIKGGLDNPPPKGESLRDVINRCFEGLNIIISDMMYDNITNAAVVTHSGIIMNILSCFGIPKRKPMEYACDFGEGFQVIVTADMWQRSNVFEILGRYPDMDEQEQYYFTDLSDIELSDQPDEDD